MHRTKLLCKETIPSNLPKIEYSKSRSESHDPLEPVMQNRKRLEQLVSDYDMYKGSVIKYQEFFKLYGRQIEKDFKKNPQNYESVNILAEVVEIVQKKPANQFTSFRKSPLNVSLCQDQSREREIQ